MSPVNTATLYRTLVTRANLPGNTTRLVNILAGYGPRSEEKFLAMRPDQLEILSGMGNATHAQAIQLQVALRSLNGKDKAKPVAEVAPVSYALEQRYRLIDFLLAHYGWINRAMVMDYFGISSASASNDIACYTELAPSNLYYNAKTKRYEITDDFLRVYP